MVDQALPDYDNLRTAFARAWADRDIELALRLVTAVPELAQLRIGYEASGWAERVLTGAEPDHPRYVAAAGAAARGRGTAASSPSPGPWPCVPGVERRPPAPPNRVSG